ncbi:hypothetical protein MRB53_002260 [Persea americana]|uniref:Uncharacterized protein n=1 Tax=Persea americana TaxID=3435 RepID=A0ACC2MTZ6_PERAE|nr:hypothetical protein MRB53_002260 [Persea americana]
MHILFTIHLALLILVGFCGEQERWVGLASQLERVQGFLVEQSANSSCRESDKVLPDLKCTTCNSTHPSLCLGIAFRFFTACALCFSIIFIHMARCFRKGRWMTHYTDVEKVDSLKVGQQSASVLEFLENERRCR